MRLRFENHETGALGIGERRPRLSWIVDRAPEGYSQRAYEIVGRLTAPDGSTERFRRRVASSEQVYVPWPARPLASRERAEVRVRVVGADLTWSGWSDLGHVEAGLLEVADWVARPIGPGWPEEPATVRRPPLLRTEFTVPGGVRRARLYVTAHGLAELEVNGQRVGADELTPGWSSYPHRLRYYTYDVGSLVVEGRNAVGAWLADGWYRGRLGFGGGTWDVYGSQLALLAQLELVTEAGELVTIGTGPGWKAGRGPLRAASLYDGELFDAREAAPGWSQPGFDDAGWQPVAERRVDLATLTAPDGPPVRCTGELHPTAIEHPEDGRYLIDFGQNHAGRLRVRPTGPAGTTITLRHAEVLEGGELCTRPLRQAACTDVLVLGDEGPVEWEPRFTTHGYRYAEVSGWPGELRPGDVVSRVVHTDMERIGDFWCSDPDVQRLHENVVWSMRSNFVGIPCDCPQRDERLGWTGDLQVFAPTASFLYDTSGMLSDWLRSLAAEQRHFGTVPLYAPFVPGVSATPGAPSALWGDVTVLAPWTLYCRFGDVAVLERQYESARAWVEQVTDLAGPGRVWDSGRQLGDWLDPLAPPDEPTASRTDGHLVATAYFARSAAVLADIAAVLGREDDAVRYTALAGEVRGAFAARYLLPDGRATSDTQTAYSLAIVFDLLPDATHRDLAGARLAELVLEHGGTIATGFAGTPVICDALSLTGHTDVAYRLLLERGCPSWLYPVTMGATTVWERWDSMLPDGTVNPGEMTSFNHYALGSIADWLHRVVAGLAPTSPGYRTIRVAPRPGGGLTYAGARHRTGYGEARVDWQIDAEVLTVDVTVPVGVTAEVDLPGSPRTRVEHGRHVFRTRAPDAAS